jgi:hypothetical protein
LSCLHLALAALRIKSASEVSRGRNDLRHLEQITEPGRDSAFDDLVRRMVIDGLLRSASREFEWHRAVGQAWGSVGSFADDAKADVARGVGGIEKAACS